MRENRLKAYLNLVVVLCVALSWQNADAQEVKYLNSDYLTRYDQLEGNTIIYVYGDKEGNLWISTFANGLIKFDGYDFEFLYHNPYDSTSIGPKYMTSVVCEDKHGNLWIGSYNEVYKYTPKTNSFTTYDFTDLIDDKIPSEYKVIPYDITTDSLGNVFFGMYNQTSHGGVPQTLLYFDAKANKIKRLASKNGYDLKNVFRITTAPGNNIWALNHDGLFRIDQQMEIHEITNLPNYFIDNHENGGAAVAPDRLYTGLKSDAMGVIWLTTNKAELYSFDPISKTLELHLLPSTFADDIPSESIYPPSFIWGISFDKEGNIYVGTQKTAIKYNPTTKTSWVFEKDQLPESWIFDINEDAFGNRWMRSEGGELMMDFDPEKTQQIMSNLLSNAVKFTPAEGHVHVLVRAVSEKGSPQKGSLLQIKVKNTGAGIPEDQLPYIFDRFYQVDDSTTRVGEGSGIGLALVKELVKLMKGDISVKSKVGKETEFTLLLPITNIAPEGQTPAPTVKYETAGLAEAGQRPLSIAAEQKASETILAVTKPNVLLVEDNPDVVAYIASCLQGQYDIQVGKDGQEGIEIALENIPDLIITDVMMPYKDGFEVCHALKRDERTSHIPIIMLTAKADLESKIAGLEQGADAYLAKPFHKKELLVRIKKLLELRENLQKHYLSIVGSDKLEQLVANTPEVPAKENQFILKLREVVEAHLEDFDFTVEQFCQEVAMSHSQLLRKITALTGLTPNQFIRHIRLNKAKLLLQDPETSINAVAYSTGFKDPAYFSRVFKKEFGMTPQEWK